MTILDRYILSAIAAAFLFGVAMFMALLMAMELLPDLIKLIAEQGVAPGMALAILGYQIPGLLVYAFPMSTLLCILLVFNRMSADSEMVAIRAGGISFLRIVAPALLFALLVTAMTYWITDRFMPYARQESNRLRGVALMAVQTSRPISYDHREGETYRYSLRAEHLDVQLRRMRGVELIYRERNAPAVFIYAASAVYDLAAGRWQFENASAWMVRPGAPERNYALYPVGSRPRLNLQSYAAIIKESPFDLDAARQRPEDFSAVQLRQRIVRLYALGADRFAINELRMELASRYAVPFSCLVFALIGAPLGLRHHRTSSAVGLGISLLLIIIYYFVAHYLSMLGDTGSMPAWLAAWLPNVLGAAVGVGLMIKANQ
ncbi:MAG TPA: LptF/LptG family permease [Armatimonadota bacterium]|nr:LptF/LptG family permease [Armatimonadota bacterium]